MGVFLKCYDITLYPPAIMAEIRQLFGPPFGWWESIKRGGTGSPPLRWMHGPDFLNGHIGTQAPFAVVNLEFRPQSLILRVNVQGKVFLLMGIKPESALLIEKKALPGTDDRFDTCLELLSQEGVICRLACRTSDFPRLQKQWNQHFKKSQP